MHLVWAKKELPDLFHQPLLAMRRSGFFLALWALPLLAGCAAYGHEGIYREAPYYDAPRRSHYQRVEQDARRYAHRLDGALHLSRRQEQRIRRLLADRAYALLDRTRPSDHRYVYPFPRRYHRQANRRVARWWRETDRRIESLLDRRQLRSFRALTGRDDYGEDRYRRQHRRY